MSTGRPTDPCEPLIRHGSCPSKIDGVSLYPLTTHRDHRGTLTELLRNDWSEVFNQDMPFAQVYVSQTAPGVARDEDRWHIHQHQTDRFYCLAGRIVVAVADVREDSNTRGNLMLVELAAQEGAPAQFLITIPPGTLHGFVVTSDEPALLLNFPNRLYDPDDEGRVPFTEAKVKLPDGNDFTYDYVRTVG